MGNEVKVKERPIIFGSPMIRALLDDKKTQTRRIVKPQPIKQHHIGYLSRGAGVWKAGYYVLTHYASTVSGPLACPYGQPGDRLWVRETHALRLDVNVKSDPEKAKQYCLYRADEAGNPADEMNWHDYGGKWRSPIFMPREVSRITLEVVSVRVERLQEISEADARTEGVCESHLDDGVSARPSFGRGWDSINARRGFGWNKNPWVFVVEFRRVTAD